jgi:hypothetical protein
MKYLNIFIISIILSILMLSMSSCIFIDDDSGKFKETVKYEVLW